jgi:hypothetical protein
MEYLRTALPIAVALPGDDVADRVVRLALRQVGMQHHRDAAATLGVPARGDAAAFARFLAAMARGQGDAATVRGSGDAVVVEQSGPGLLDGVGAPQRAAVLRAWAGLWEGALASHDRRLALEVVAGGAADSPSVSVSIGPRAGG